MSDNLLKLSVTEFERDPSGQTFYVSLTVRAAAGEFSGQSECVVLGRDLESFLAALEALAGTSQGEARLVGGWGDSEYVQLRFAPRGRLGHVAIRVLLRDHDSAADRRLEASFESEPQALARSCQQIRRALHSEQVGEFQFYGRGGSAV